MRLAFAKEAKQEPREQKKGEVVEEEEEAIGVEKRELGCDEPFKTGGAVIEADIDSMNPAPPAVLEPVKYSGEAICEGVKIIGGVDKSCEEGEKGEKEKGCGEESAKG